ncbi:hypothetical protein BJ878DRAFT_312430 [Calycina marina]|uniref:F-box domain-containing protein n=1 Tax=Calycina marina TaxID=1763456 RepID=A0A9P8CGV8_9HELO|nr:hypothetical protein BJ878DRAFT_312430 [Calycina marina]
MHFHEPAEDEDLQPLVNLTENLQIISKRSTREEKKRQRKEKARKNRLSLLDLPSELVVDILGHMLPRDVFVLSRVSQSVRRFVQENEERIAGEVIGSRYMVLKRCFQLPLRLEQVDVVDHLVLLGEEKPKNWYQHIAAPDSQELCCCRTCIMNWNNLCLMVDFTYWQDNLDNGDPLPVIQRGQYPEWNQELITKTAAIILKALYSPLLLGAVFEKYLQSIVRSIRRQRENKGNKRRRFRMTDEDVFAETDVFLERSGPPTMEIPFIRDRYYLLEAYLPNRAWIGEHSKWVYAGSMHSWDLQRLKTEAVARRKQKAPVSCKDLVICQGCGKTLSIEADASALPDAIS